VTIFAGKGFSAPLKLVLQWIDPRGFLSRDDARQALDGDVGEVEVGRALHVQLAVALRAACIEHDRAGLMHHPEEIVLAHAVRAPVVGGLVGGLEESGHVDLRIRGNGLGSRTRGGHEEEGEQQRHTHGSLRDRAIPVNGLT